MTEHTSLLDFPCSFALKVVGHSSPALKDTVLTIIQNHVAEIDKSTVKSRPSKNGKYTALTVTIVATSQVQLDAIYHDLTDCDAIVMAL
jgi:putative lipoic acid-binding regulatory protein